MHGDALACVAGACFCVYFLQEDPEDVLDQGLPSVEGREGSPLRMEGCCGASLVAALKQDVEQVACARAMTSAILSWAQTCKL